MGCDTAIWRARIGTHQHQRSWRCVDVPEPYSDGGKTDFYTDMCWRLFACIIVINYVVGGGRLLAQMLPHAIEVTTVWLTAPNQSFGTFHVLVSPTLCTYQPFLPTLLMQAGDIESNPGPGKDMPPSFNNWVKCSEGLVECCAVASRIVQQVMENWHQTEIHPFPDKYKCETQSKCPPKKKPKKATKQKAGSCKPCCQWADDVIPKKLAANKDHYPSWDVVKSSDFYDHVIEVAKLFGSKGVDEKITKDIKHFHEFDSAWLLFILDKVKLFHKGDIQTHVQEASDTRNTIMHRPVGRDLPDSELDHIFQSFSTLLTSFKDNFPSVISEKEFLRMQVILDQIKNMETVTSGMVQKAIANYLKEVETWKNQQGADIKTIQVSLQYVVNVCKDFPGLQLQVEKAEKKLGTLEAKVEGHRAQLEDHKAQLEDHRAQIVEMRANPVDLTTCQEQLKAMYARSRGGISFLPGFPKDFPLEEFFVDLTLVQEEKRPTEVLYKNLVKYTDLLTLENRNGKVLSHVLVRGEAGSGKTTLINKLAYQWSTCASKDDVDDAQTPLRKFELVFALNIREIEPGMDLVDCILEQLLGDYFSKESGKESITNMLKAHAAKCLFLLDGYDELKSDQKVLNNQFLLRSFVIVTTRPDKVDQFCLKFCGFVQVQLKGFSKRSRNTFITRYFGDSEAQDSASDLHLSDYFSDDDSIDSQSDVYLQITSGPVAADLISKIRRSYLDSISVFPLLLAMICSIYNKFEELPLRMTALYMQANNVFATQYYAKTSSSAVLSEKQRLEVDGTLLFVGSTALHGLVIDDAKLIFNREDFEIEKQHGPTSSTVWITLFCYLLLVFLGFELTLQFGMPYMKLISIFISLLVGYILHYCISNCTTLSTSSNESLEIAESLGILTKVPKHHTRYPECDQYSFHHKTFQEFAAAIYWSSLISNRSKFEYYLSKINKDNVESMQYLLRFCCGLSYDAAECILQHVVRKCEVDWRLAATLLFEAERDSQIHPKLHEILMPLKVVMGNLTAELWSILQCYINDRHGEQTWLSGITELSISFISTDEIDNMMQFISCLKELDIKPLTSMTIEHLLLYCAYDESKLRNVTTRFLTSQLHLLHLALTSHIVKGWVWNWDGILTPEYLTCLVPNLESLTISPMSSNGIVDLLDVFINAGKRMESSHDTETASGSSQHLPIRTFDITCSDYVETDVHRPQTKTAALLPEKLKEAVSFMPSLEHLALHVSLTAASLQVLLPVFSRKENLTTLDLGHIVDFQTVHNDFHDSGNEISQILWNATNLLELYLSGTQLDGDDIRVLSLNLPAELKLSKLDLSDNELGSLGLIRLSNLLRHTPMLTELNLSENNVDQQGVAAFTSSLQHIPLLEVLKMTLLDEESYILLAQGFRYIPKLRHLDLRRFDQTMNMMSVKAAEVICQNLTHVALLQELLLDVSEENYYFDITQTALVVLYRDHVPVTRRLGVKELDAIKRRIERSSDKQ